MFQPEANIFLNRLRENYYNLQSLVGNAKIMGVIKANAYGHGALPVSRILSDSGIYGFCVALSSEAEELIRSGIQKPILHLGRIHKHNLELYNSGQVHCTINSFDDLKILEQYYSGNKPIKTHLKTLKHNTPNTHLHHFPGNFGHLKKLQKFHDLGGQAGWGPGPAGAQGTTSLGGKDPPKTQN